MASSAVCGPCLGDALVTITFALFLSASQIAKTILLIVAITTTRIRTISCIIFLFMLMFEVSYASPVRPIKIGDVRRPDRGGFFEVIAKYAREKEEMRQQGSIMQNRGLWRLGSVYTSTSGRQPGSMIPDLVIRNQGRQGEAKVLMEFMILPSFIHNTSHFEAFHFEAITAPCRYSMQCVMQ